MTFLVLWLALGREFLSAQTLLGRRNSGFSHSLGEDRSVGKSLLLRTSGLLEFTVRSISKCHILGYHVGGPNKLQ